MQKHRGDKEWTDDFAIMTNVRFFSEHFFLPFKQHVTIKCSIPKANDSGNLAMQQAIPTRREVLMLHANMFSGDCNVDEAGCPRYQHFSHGSKSPRLHSVNK